MRTYARGQLIKDDRYYLLLRYKRGAMQLSLEVRYLPSQAMNCEDLCNRKGQT